MIRFFETKLSFLLTSVCLLLLFMPKINLITFGGRETAGLRIDDFILLFAGGAIVLGSLLQKRSLLTIELWLIVLLLFSLFSFFVNQGLVALGVLDYPAHFLYCIRLFEYFIFFYIGALAIQFFSLDKIINLYVVLTFTLIVFQKFGYIGEFGLSGYSPHAAYRPSGLSAFPSEMGAVLNILFCFLLFKQVHQKQNQFPGIVTPLISKLYIYLLFIAFAFCIVLTGSRIALIALVVPFLFKLKEEVSFRQKGLPLISLLILVGIAIAFYMFISQMEAIASRSKGLFSYNNIQLMQDVWEQIDISYEPIGNEVVAFGNVDLSWWLRVHKWGYVLKIFYLNPECWLQGIGPGFAFSGLDGGLLRILVEYGFIGFFLFWKVFRCIYRTNIQLKWMLIAFAINMLTFDAHLAYKPMSFLFFIAGYKMCTEQSQEIIKRKVALR